MLHAVKYVQFLNSEIVHVTQMFDYILIQVCSVIKYIEVDKKASRVEQEITLREYRYNSIRINIHVVSSILRTDK